MSERVINVKAKPRAEYDVFIGRPSKWGNPFRIGPDGTREQVVAKYRVWVTQHPTLDPRELRGQVLGCFCAPLACHGDVLAELSARPTSPPAEPTGREWWVKRLSGLYDDASARKWLDSPHALLNGLTAWYCIKTGQQDRVLAIIDQLESGAFA